MAAVDLSFHLHGHGTAFIIAEMAAYLLIGFFITQLPPIFRRQAQLGSGRRKLDLRQVK